jgi:hypothetical protein
MEGDIAEWQEWMKQLPTEWKLFLTVEGQLVPIDAENLDLVLLQKNITIKRP